MVSPTVKLNANRLNRMSSYSAEVLPSHTFVPIESLTASPTSSTGSASVLEWNSNSDSELFQLSSPATLTASPSPQNSGAAMHFSLPSLVIEEDERHREAQDEELILQWEEESFNTVQAPALCPPTTNPGDVTNSSTATTDPDGLETPQDEDQVDKICDDMVQWFIKSSSLQDRDRRISSFLTGQDPFISMAPSQDAPAVPLESAPQRVVSDMSPKYQAIAAVEPHSAPAQTPLVSCSLFMAPISSPSSLQSSIPVVNSPKIFPPSPSPIVIVSDSASSSSPPSPAPYLDKGKAPALQRNKISIAEYFKRKAAEKESAASSPTREVIAPVPVPMSVSHSAVTPIIMRSQSVNSDLSYCTEPRARTPPVPMPEQDNTNRPPVILISSSPINTSRYLTPEPYCRPPSCVSPPHPPLEGNTLQPPLIWVAPPNSGYTPFSSYQRSPNDLLKHPRLHRSPIVPSSTTSGRWNPAFTHLPFPAWRTRNEVAESWGSTSVGMGVEFVPPTVSPPSTRTNSPSTVSAARTSLYPYVLPRDVPSYNSSMSGREIERASVENSFINHRLSPISSRSEIESSRTSSPRVRSRSPPSFPPVPAWADRVHYPYVPANGGVEAPQASSWLNYTKLQVNKPGETSLPFFGPAKLPNSADSSANVPAWLKNTAPWQPPASTPRPKSPTSTLQAGATPQFALQPDAEDPNNENAQESYAEALPSSWSHWNTPKNVHPHSLYETPNIGTYSGASSIPARPPAISHGRATSTYPTHNNASGSWARTQPSIPPISPYTYNYLPSPFVPAQNSSNVHSSYPLNSPYNPRGGLRSTGPFPSIVPDISSHGQYTGSTLPRDRKLQAPPPFSPWGCQVDPPQRRLRFAPMPTAHSSYKPASAATTPLHPIPPHTFTRTTRYDDMGSMHSPPSPTRSPQSLRSVSPNWASGLLPRTQPSPYTGPGVTGFIPNSNFGYRSNKQFSFVDATVVFRVENCLYRVHRHFFERHSVHLARLLASYNFSPITHMFLPDVTKEDFDRLLTIFYPLSLTEPDITDVEGWSSILSIAIKWEMSQVKALAIQKLTPIASAAQKIGIATKNNMDNHEWLLPAYTQLCSRRSPLSLEEAEELELPTVVKIWQVQHEIFNLRDVRTPSQLTMLVKEKFGLQDVDRDTEAAAHHYQTSGPAQGPCVNIRWCGA